MVIKERLIVRRQIFSVDNQKLRHWMHSQLMSSTSYSWILTRLMNGEFESGYVT